MNECPHLGGLPVQDHEVDLDAAYGGFTPLSEEPVTDYDPSPEWVMLRLRGGAHDGEAHLCPVGCSWVCGDCGATYLPSVVGPVGVGENES